MNDQLLTTNHELSTTNHKPLSLLAVMKKIHVAGIIALVVIADQALKIYVKTHFYCGETFPILGKKFFSLDFIENPGMAYGLEFGGNFGKMALTIFRFGAVIFGTWYLGNIIKKKYNKGFIFCAALIYAGALGNLIDSAFYGMIFDKGMYFDPSVKDYVCYPPNEIAKLGTKGYQSFLHGNVVDMLHFNLWEGRFPKWFPFWGDTDFQFFRPIFNIADAAISIGVFSIFIFQKRFFRQHNTPQNHPTVETGAVVSDEAQVL